MKFLKHLFLPQFSNNQRARLIHNQILFLFVLFFAGASLFISLGKQKAPQVLGVNVDVAASELLALTNQNRANAGLAPLQMNAQLAAAAEAKAQDMFARQYWAHFAPDGTSPWDFIHNAGYNYVYAGENLARGFTTSGSVINAWMASPEHRANMLSHNYSDVGFAIEQGPLPGDNSTVLVVEMFGSRTLGASTSTVPPVVAPVVTTTPEPGSAAGQLAQVPSPTPAPVLSAVKKQVIFDSAFYTKLVSLSLLSLFVLIFGMDVVMTESRKTIRLTGHSFDHLLFLIGILIIAISLGLGVVG